MISCTKRLTFAAGHRVYKHESKCANMHGHNYAVLLTAAVDIPKVKIPKQGKDGKPQLDYLGRVIDFGVLKKKFGTWIDKNWDHGFILYEQDFEALAALKMTKGSKIYRLPNNPTAENLAIHLFERVAPAVLRGTSVKLTKVVVWETETCYAEVGAG